jgi:hypothetical protein
MKGAAGMASIKRVSYSYSSVLEDQGLPAYFLDVLVCEDKETIVDRHESFESREDLYDAMEEVLPVLEEACDSGRSL